MYIFKLLWNLNPEQTFCFIGLERVCLIFQRFSVHFMWEHTFSFWRIFEYVNESVLMTQYRLHTHLYWFYSKLSDTFTMFQTKSIFTLHKDKPSYCHFSWFCQIEIRVCYSFFKWNCIFNSVPFLFIII